MQSYRKNAKKKQRRGSQMMKIMSFVLALFLMLESVFGQSGMVAAKAEEETAGALAEEIIEIYTEEDFNAKPEDVLDVQTADGEAEIDGVVWKYELTSGNVEIIQGSEFGSNTEIKIPSKIGGKSVTSIGDRAFYDCYNLKIVRYTGSESEWNEIEIESGNDVLEEVQYIYNYDPSQETDPAPSLPQPGEGEVSPTPTAQPTPIGIIILLPTPTAQPTPAASKNVVPGASKVNGEWISAKQAQPKITKAASLKKSFKLTWKKVSSVKGYQVQYALDKKFKKSAKKKTISKAKTTSIKIKGLKAKTKYYVRMRTFKTTKLNGKTVKVYSKWSKAKTVKTK